MSGKTFNLVTAGNEKRKYLYIDDAVQAIVRSIIKGAGVFNIAGNDETSINDLIEVLEDVWGSKLNILREKEDRHGVDITPIIDKARKEIDFYPEVSLRKGLQMIYDSEIF